MHRLLDSLSHLTKLAPRAGAPATPQAHFAASKHVGLKSCHFSHFLLPRLLHLYKDLMLPCLVVAMPIQVQSMMNHTYWYVHALRPGLVSIVVGTRCVGTWWHLRAWLELIVLVVGIHVWPRRHA